MELKELADHSRQLLNTEAENEITVCAFRLLTMDLLVLYGVMNEGTINVLGKAMFWRFLYQIVDMSPRALL